MTVRELLATLSEHAEDGRLLNDVVHVRVGRELRTLDSAYMDGTLVLVAGPPAN